MNVVLISQSASRVAPAILAQDVATVAGVVESAPRGFDPTSPPRPRFLDRIRRLVRPARTLKDLARRHRVHYFLYHPGNTEELVAWLRGRKVDLIVVQSMSQLLPREVLAVPPLGILNLHASLLPAYRGPNPWIWVFHNDEPRTGVTLHYIDPGEDTGDIVYRKEIEIPRGSRLPELLDEAIGTIGSNLILKALRALAAGEELPRQEQPARSPTARARNITNDEYPALIDWAHWSTERVWHFLRGTESFLRSTLGHPPSRRGKRPRIGDYAEEDPGAAPGTLGTDDHGLFLACRDGKVRIVQG